MPQEALAPVLGALAAPLSALAAEPWLPLVAALAVGLPVLAVAARLARRGGAKRRCLAKRPIEASEFLSGWITERDGRRAVAGYKADFDVPGCYVITCGVDRRGNYEDVYVGQSQHLASRVRSHLTGHGNGNVFADVREGRRVEVRLVPCDERDMNKVERRLIAAFGATGSYNETAGGGYRR